MVRQRYHVHRGGHGGTFITVKSPVDLVQEVFVGVLKLAAIVRGSHAV